VCWKGKKVYTHAHTPHTTHYTLQFVDDLLDIKYRPEFLIFVAQGKLLLSAVSPMFADTNVNLVLTVAGTGTLNICECVCVRDAHSTHTPSTSHTCIHTRTQTVFLTFAIINVWVQPCLVKRVNILKTAVYISCCWTCVPASVVEGGASPTVGYAMVISGWALVFGLAALYHHRKWSGFTGDEMGEIDNSKMSIFTKRNKADVEARQETEGANKEKKEE
jgi:hypothetical protein